MRSAVLACCFALAAGPAFAQKQVNVYNWSDYIAEDQLKVFTSESGIKVNYTTYDTNEILDAKLKTGRSGYDVVVPTASPFCQRSVEAFATARAPSASSRYSALICGSQAATWVSTSSRTSEGENCLAR